MIIYFAFFFSYPLIFISDQYFDTAIVTVGVRVKRATKNSFPCVSRWLSMRLHQVGWTMRGRDYPKFETPPQSLAMWCATLWGRDVVWTMGSDDHPKFGTPPRSLAKWCERWGVTITQKILPRSITPQRSSYVTGILS